MAMFDQHKAQRIPSTDDRYNRTQTRLVADEGDAPSSRVFPDPRLPALFQFHFGGQDGWIVIPKGRIVAIEPELEFKHFDDGKYYNAITIANGGVDVTEQDGSPDADDLDTYTRVANTPIGVEELNVYKDIKNSFKGTVPNFITRKTINLPLFPDGEMASEVEWGSAYGDLKPGDRVMSDEYGRFVEYKPGKLLSDEFKGSDAVDADNEEFQLKAPIHPETEVADIEVTVNGDPMGVEELTNATGLVTLVDDPDVEDDDDVIITYRSVLSSEAQVVGRIVTVDKNLVPAGWLKWVMPDDDGQDYGDFGYENDHGFRTQDLEGANGTPFDPSYRYGYNRDPYRPTGIPGLTDGTYHEKDYEEVLGVIPEDVPVGTKYNFRVNHRPIAEGSLTVEFDGDEVSEAVDFVNEEEGLIIVEVVDEGNMSAMISDDKTNTSIEVVADYSATGQYPGMPSNINFEGTIGSVDILLQL